MNVKPPSDVLVTRKDIQRGPEDRVDPRHRGLQTVLHGVYVDEQVLVTPYLLWRAALRLSPKGSVLSHHTAAVALGGVVPTEGTIHVAVPGETRCLARGLESHRTGTDQGVTEHNGWPVTTPERTFLELASKLCLVDLVVFADSLMRRNLPLTTPDRLRESANEFHGRGARLARRAAALARANVDSPMETRLRLLIVLAGLPEPDINIEICDEYGVVLRRFDMGYARIRLAIEFDGRQHAESVEQWRSDVFRREAVDDDGWRLVTVLSDGVFVRPEQTLARIVKVARAQGMALKVTSQEWRRHFPGRAA